MGELVERAKEAIAHDVSRNVPLAELARAVRCSPSRLSRTFRRTTGHTMAGYRHALRILAAIERLRDGDVDLTELALDLGFSSHSHFTSVFRRHLGITPSELRAKNCLARCPPAARQSARPDAMPGRAHLFIRGSEEKVSDEDGGIDCVSDCPC
jgi:AraC-like DNA-binding protein